MTLEEEKDLILAIRRCGKTVGTMADFGVATCAEWRDCFRDLQSAVERSATSEGSLTSATEAVVAVMLAFAGWRLSLDLPGLSDELRHDWEHADFLQKTAPELEIPYRMHQSLNWVDRLVRHHLRSFVGGDDEIVSMQAEAFLDRLPPEVVFIHEQKSRPRRVP